MHPRIRTSPLLLLLLTMIAALALPAASARAEQVSASVTGVLNNGSSFDGTFRVNRFRSTRLGVVASGLLIGTVTSGNGRVTDVISNRITVPVVDVRSPGTSCDVLLFTMDRVDMVQTNFTLHVDAFDMDIDSNAIGFNFGGQFCTIAHAFDTGQFTQMASSLNNVLDILNNL